jgi:hypothetical protein
VESFSEEDIAEGAKLLREVEKSDLTYEVKTSLSRFAERAARAAARLEEAEERAARYAAEPEELRGLRDAEKLVGLRTVGFRGGAAPEANADGSYRAEAVSDGEFGSAEELNPAQRGATAQGGAAQRVAAAKSAGSAADRTEQRRADLRAAQEALQAAEAEEKGRGQRSQAARQRSQVATRERRRAEEEQFGNADEDWRDGQQWDTPAGAFDEEDDFDEESSVPYISRTSGRVRRPHRLFEQQNEGFIEAVNLLERGEYEEVVSGWSHLSDPAKYETEYLLPMIIGRLYDVRFELDRVNRAAPGRIPAGILEEVGRMFELGRERLAG